MKQVQALTLCFSRETVTVVENLGLTPAQLQDVKFIVDAIQRHVEGNVNKSVKRHTFRHRVQQAGECFDDILVSLRKLAKTCNFCSQECTNKNMRNQIIKGLREQTRPCYNNQHMPGPRSCKKTREITNTGIREPADVYAVRRQNPPQRLAPGVGTSSTMVTVSTVQRLTSHVTPARRLAVSPECAREERHHHLPHHHPIHQTHELSQ